MGPFGKSKGRPMVPPIGGTAMSYVSPMPPFGGMSSPAVSPYPSGHVPPHVRQQCTVRLKSCMKDLSNLKRAGTLNPNYMMTEKWLQVLSTIMEPMCVLAPPGKGMQDWLMEVQILMNKLKERVMKRGVPLTPPERQHLLHFSQLWLRSRGGPTDTYAPHAQIVLFSLGELAQM